MTEPKYQTLTISIHRIAEVYHVELSYEDPDSQAQVAPLQGAAALDLAALASSRLSYDDYGKVLATQLFADEALAQHFVHVETAAHAAGGVLRVVLCIDSSAQELQGLRWELLRHPRAEVALSTSERVLLSRFMVSRDWRPVKLRARAELRALVVVAAPAGEELRRLGLAPIDHEGELQRARVALSGLEVRTLGGPGDPATLERLIAEIRQGADVVYVVAHGMYGRRTSAAAIILQDDAGKPRPVQGDELATRIGELQRGPRLVVLASCHGAGDGDPLDAGQRPLPQAALAGRMTDAGVPGVIAMQGLVSVETVEAMMPVFFAELLHDGRIDRALGAARGAVRARADAWMPALYTRLSGGRLWYTPGFRTDKAKEVWRRLLAPVARGKVVPIVGPRLLENAYGTAHDTAQRLAHRFHYPLAAHEWDDLPRVTEYMAVKESRYNVVQAYQDQLLADLIEQHRDWLPPEEIPPVVKKPKLGRLLALVSEHLRQRPSDVYRVLAALPASVYVTTTFDPLLEWALRAAERPPRQLVTRWCHGKVPRAADGIGEPSAKAPLVYHAFGAFGSTGDDSMVLTEDDYFDFLIDTVSAKLIPPVVESALVDNSLLFLGFRLTDWHFRVLFRLMMSLPGRERLKQYCHVAVQLDPDMQTMSDVEGAKEYLATYFGQEANIDIYWGSAEEFLAALRDELAGASEPSVDAEPEVTDEWDF